MGTGERDRASLIRDRDFFTDRLTEIALELKRLIAEADDLKVEMERHPDLGHVRQGEIRRRRAYLKRRSDDLKVERQSAKANRESIAQKLAAEP